MTTIEAKCPKCGLRVDVSALEHRVHGPTSKCTHKDGWSVCSDLRASLSSARTELNRPQRPASLSWESHGYVVALKQTLG
jgi:hypothetical protein